MMSEDKKVDVTQTIIFHEDAPTLPPPRLEVGAIAWLRQNLFGSAIDAVITVISFILVVVLLISFFDWAIRSANWFAVINNQRLFMLDRLEQEFEWRVALSVLLVAILTGVSFSVWARRSMRSLTIFALGLVAVMALLPPLIQATIAPPPSNFSAGNVEIIDRASTIMPQPALAFIAQEGETVDIRLATEITANDDTLKDLSGFSDRTTNTLANAAQNRHDQQIATGDSFDRMVSRELTETLEERTRVNISTFMRTNDMASSTIEFATVVRERLVDGQLTATQVEVWIVRLEDAVDSLEEPDEAILSAIDAVDSAISGLSSEETPGEDVQSALDDLTTAVIESPNIEAIGEALVNGITVDLIGEEAQADKDEDLISPTAEEAVFLHDMFVLLLTPQSVTETYDISETSMQVAILDGQTLDVISQGVVTPAGEVVTAEIPADGWYVLTKNAVEGESGTAILEVNGIYPIVERVRGANLSTFVRLTDNELSVTDARPVIDESNVPFAVLIDNQYRGHRDLSTYLIHFVPLFLEQLERLLLPFIITIAWGFLLGRALAHVLGEESHFSNAPSRMTVLGLALSPLVILLIYFGPVNGDFGMTPMDGILAVIVKIALAVAAVVLVGQIDSWLTRMNNGEDAEANITNLLIYGWGIFPVAMYVLASGIGGFSGAMLGSAIGGLIWLVVMYFVGLNFKGILGYGLVVAGFFLQIVQAPVIDMTWDTWISESPPILSWILFAVIGTAIGIWGHSLRDRISFSIKRYGYLASGTILIVSILAPSLLSIPSETTVQAIEGLSIVAWIGLMFFSGVHNWNSGRLTTGLLILTFLWLQISTPLDLWSSIFFVVWLTVGVVAFNRGEEAGRDGRKVVENGEKSTMQRLALPGLVIAGISWLVVLFLIPNAVTTLESAGILQTSPNDLLPLSDKRAWGGLMLTMQITILGIGASFPIGLALALGRRSNLPVVKTACILYIETVRGVPLITVLFMATLLVPLVDPSLATIEGAVRVWVGVTMFSAAYLAENVRGGLQSIPTGQTEAAQAIGLSGWQTTLFILLPQALRAVIPALVGQFISLFKDTSLVVIVGLAEITGIAIRVVAQPEFLQKRQETFLYIAIIYFVFSYIMSYISRRVEETGSGAARAQQI